MSHYEEAKKVFDCSVNYGSEDGNKIVEILLKDRNIDDLSEDEFYLLTRGYNWAHKDCEAVEASIISVQKYPNNMEFFESLWAYMCNCYGDSTEQLITKAKENIKLKLGSPVFWYLRIADELLDMAYMEEDEQDYEWRPDRKVINQKNLDLAAEYLKKAVSLKPELLEDGYSDFPYDAPWNHRYEALLIHEKYSKLKRK